MTRKRTKPVVSNPTTTTVSADGHAGEDRITGIIDSVLAQIADDDTLGRDPTDSIAPTTSGSGCLLQRMIETKRHQIGASTSDGSGTVSSMKTDGPESAAPPSEPTPIATDPGAPQSSSSSNVCTEPFEIINIPVDEESGSKLQLLQFGQQMLGEWPSNR